MGAIMLYFVAFIVGGVFGAVLISCAIVSGKCDKK